MPLILYESVPYSHEDITLALECGVDALIVPTANIATASALSRTPVLCAENFQSLTLHSKADEQVAAEQLAIGQGVRLAKPWGVIPVENLLAVQPEASLYRTPTNIPAFKGLALDVASASEAALAATILEKGVQAIIVLPTGISELHSICNELHDKLPNIKLDEAVITELTPVGMGHRVCIDTLSILEGGQGMLVGNSAAFTFLVHAETEQNEYVAARPFRVNAGAAHSYLLLPNDKTCYLEELTPGQELVVINAKGQSQKAVAGRIKTERRPLLMIKARSANGQEGVVFLQNAETIKLISPEGKALSLASLQTGDKILCHLDTAGRHFGMRVEETIQE